jgi:putative transposase
VVELVLAALDMVVTSRRPADVIHHSDQGGQYPSIAFGLRCREESSSLSTKPGQLQLRRNPGV